MDDELYKRFAAAAKDAKKRAAKENRHLLKPFITRTGGINVRTSEGREAWQQYKDAILQAEIEAVIAVYEEHYDVKRFGRADTVYGGASGGGKSGYVYQNISIWFPGAGGGGGKTEHLDELLKNQGVDRASITTVEPTIVGSKTKEPPTRISAVPTDPDYVHAPYYEVFLDGIKCWDVFEADVKKGYVDEYVKKPDGTYETQPWGGVLKTVRRTGVVMLVPVTR